MTLSYNTVADGIEAEIRALGDLAVKIAAAYDEEAEAAVEWKSHRAFTRTTLRREHSGERLPLEWYDDMAEASGDEKFGRHIRAVNTLAMLREERSIRTARLDGLRTLAAGMRAAGG